ncbi:MAG: YCF48-related protein [Candidatus Krumholzibacteriia bacterium]
MIRRSIVAVMLLLAVALPALAYDWEWRHPVPLGQTLADVVMLDQLTGYAVGDGGSVIGTSNGGLTWRWLPTGTTTSLEAVAFRDGLSGVAVGEEDLVGGIFYTADGGDTWADVSPAGADWLMDVAFFPDGLHGVAVGRDEVMLTADGGLTWQRSDDVPDMWMSSLAVLDAQTAVAVGKLGLIARTADAGQSWQMIDSGTGEMLNSVSFGDALHGLAVGVDGTILATADGGLAWEVRGTGDGAWLEHVRHLDGDVVAIMGLEDYLAISFDGGATWSALQGPSTTSGYQTLAFRPDGEMLVATGFGGLYLSEDQRTSWTNRQASLASTLLDVTVVAGHTVVAVGVSGAVVRSYDAGESWTRVPCDGCGTLNGVDVCDGMVGYAVGDAGAAAVTEDAGRTWRAIETDITHHLMDVACLDPLTAVAVGSEGSVYRTTDGGATWQHQALTPTYDWLEAVDFVDGTHGWLCTWFGKIFHTEDGGLTWSVQFSSNLDLKGVFFLDRQLGWVVGSTDNPAILWTVDGGATWHEEPSPDYSYFMDVAFSDPLHGIATGFATYHTEDGGLTWTVDDDFDVPLRGVTYVTPDIAIMVGGGGAILRTGPSDITGAVAPPPLSHGSPVRAWPNPFNPRTVVSFDLERAGPVRLTVHDATGRRVATLVDEAREAGPQSVDWTGRTDAGVPAPSGVYLVRLSTPWERGSTRITLVR